MSLANFYSKGTLYTPKEINFNFGKPPIRKTQKDIFYNVSSGTGPNDLTDEIKLLFLKSNKPNTTNKSLNFYKNE